MRIYFQTELNLIYFPYVLLLCTYDNTFQFHRISRKIINGLRTIQFSNKKKFPRFLCFIKINSESFKFHET